MLNGDGSEGIGMDWCIREYENQEVGDCWILSRFGGNDNRIVGIGRFSKFPKPGDSWRKDGSIVHYADLHIFTFLQPEKSGILTVDVLKKQFRNPAQSFSSITALPEKHRSLFFQIRIQCDPRFLPVQQILADCMTPMDLSPCRIIRIMLEEQMAFPP